MPLVSSMGHIGILSGWLWYPSHGVSQGRGCQNHPLAPDLCLCPCPNAASCPEQLGGTVFLRTLLQSDRFLSALGTWPAWGGAAATGWAAWPWEGQPGHVGVALGTTRVSNATDGAAQFHSVNYP